MLEPCTWPISYVGCATCTPFVGMAPADQTAFEEMATSFLWRWTLRQFGVCSTVIRPCRNDCTSWSTFWGKGPYPWGSAAGSWPVLVAGKWYNVRDCTCGSSCSCKVPNSVRLPGPVSAVTQVMIDGAVVSPSAYRVDDDLLIRTDGQDWPRRQDLSLPETEAGTWQISYDRGLAVPTGGQIAAGRLACELAKAACQDGSCQLPQRLQTITRQGVTMAMLDNFTGIDKGYTGIWLIDSWVTSITQPPRGGRVFSVDVPRSKGRVSNV
jgi:hypothetical protein